MVGVIPTQIGKETQKKGKKRGENKETGVLQSLRTYCYRSVCVWLSSIRPANAGLWINKPDALCHRYLPSFLSTPSAAIANFFAGALAWGEREADSWIEVSLHQYENKLFSRVRQMKELARLALYCLESESVDHFLLFIGFIQRWWITSIFLCALFFFNMIMLNRFLLI